MAKLNARLIYVFVSVFLQGFGNSLALPVLPFVATELDGTSMQTSIMFSGYAIGSLLSSFFCGSISDKIGRKPMLIIATLGQGLSNLCVYFSSNIWMFVITRILSGCFSAVYTVGQACVADISPVKERSQNLSTIDGVLSTGYIVGAFLAGFLSEVNIRLPILVSGCVYIFACIMISALLTESAPVALEKKEMKMKIRSFKQDGKLKEAKAKEQLLKTFYKTRSTDGDASKFKFNIFVIFSLVTQFCNMYIYSAFESVYGVFGEIKYHLTAQQFSYLTAAVSLINAIQQIFCYNIIISKLHVSIPMLAIIDGIIEAIGLALAAYGPSLMWSCIGILIAVFGFGFISPSAPSIISSECPPHLQGRAMGYIVIAGQSSYAIAPILAAWLLDINQELSFTHAIVLSIIISISMLIIRLQPGGAQAGREERKSPDIETIKDIKTEEKLEQYTNEEVHAALDEKVVVQLDNCDMQNKVSIPDMNDNSISEKETNNKSDESYKNHSIIIEMSSNETINNETQKKSNETHDDDDSMNTPSFTHSINLLEDSMNQTESISFITLQKGKQNSSMYSTDSLQH